MEVLNMPLTCSLSTLNLWPISSSLAALNTIEMLMNPRFTSLDQISPMPSRLGYPTLYSMPLLMYVSVIHLNLASLQLRS